MFSDPPEAPDGSGLPAKRLVNRESTLANTMRLTSFQRAVEQLGLPGKALLALAALAVLVYVLRKLREPSHRRLLVTLLYSLLYFIASPTAILVNKILMKDKGFHYPVMVSALGQATTAVCAALSVHVFKWTELHNGPKVSYSTFVSLGAAMALAMVLGQFPYLYLTVAFIQMLKAFSPAYMVVLLSCLGVEYPSARIKAIVLGLCLSACVASAGEVNFNLVGIVFMFGASVSDALRLVLAQWLLKNLKLEAVESLYYTSPICVLWLGAALVFELPTAYRRAATRRHATAACPCPMSHVHVHTPTARPHAPPRAPPRRASGKAACRSPTASHTSLWARASPASSSTSPARS